MALSYSPVLAKHRLELPHQVIVHLLLHSVAGRLGSRVHRVFASIGYLTQTGITVCLCPCILLQS